MKKLYTVYVEYKIEYHKKAFLKEDKVTETDTLRGEEKVIFASDYVEASKLYNKWFRDDEYYKMQIKKYYKDVEITEVIVKVKNYKQSLTIEQLSNQMYAENFRDWWFDGNKNKE